MLAGTGWDRQVECAAGNVRKYEFGSECEVLWGNFGWTRPPLHRLGGLKMILKS